MAQLLAALIALGACCLAAADNPEPAMPATGPATNPSSTPATNPATAPAATSPATSPATVPAGQSSTAPAGTTDGATESAGTAGNPATTAPAAAPSTPRPPSHWDDKVGKSPLPDGASGDTGGVMVRMLATVMVVLVLGGIALVVSRRLLPRLGRGLPAGQRKQLRVLESASLGPRRTVHIVQVGNRRLLVGSGEHQVSMLADVSEATGGGFEQALKSQESQQPAANSQQPTEMTKNQ